MQASKEKVSDKQLHDFLREQPEWAHENGELVRFWTFQDFKEAMGFVNSVAGLAEEAGHHPDIDIRYNRVRLALVSHDADGITDRDLQMARRLSKHSQERSRPAA